MQYHSLLGSIHCIIRGECRKSQSIKDPFQKLWIILEKTVKLRACHWTCMAGIGETCNHVAAVMYPVEAAVWISLTNPTCTSNANEWLPNQKAINLSREDFDQRGLKLRKLVINNWVRVSPALVSGNWGLWWAVWMACTCFGQFLLEGLNAEKWCHYPKKNFFINKSVGLSTCDSPIETVKYLMINENFGWIFDACLIVFCHKTADIHFFFAYSWSTSEDSKNLDAVMPEQLLAASANAVP